MGSQSHFTAENSTFLHPVISFIPKYRANEGASDAPPSEIHLVEDVQALWDTDAEHLDPLRKWVYQLLINLTLADVVDQPLLFEDPTSDEERAEKARLEKFVYNAGEDDEEVKLKSMLATGMKVRTKSTYLNIPAGSVGTYITEEPATPPAIVRFDIGGVDGHTLSCLFVHFHNLELVDPSEASRKEDIIADIEARIDSLKRGDRILLVENWVHYTRIWGSNATVHQPEVEEATRGGDNFRGDVVLYPKGHSGIFEGIHYRSEDDDAAGGDGVMPNSFTSLHLAKVLDAHVDYKGNDVPATTATVSWLDIMKL